MSNDKLVRLIDANAILEKLEKKLEDDESKTLRDVIYILETVEPIETLEDVLDSFPNSKWGLGLWIELAYNTDTHLWFCGDPRTEIFRIGKTPLEAAVALRNKLNSK